MRSGGVVRIYSLGVRWLHHDQAGKGSLRCGRRHVRGICLQQQTWEWDLPRDLMDMKFPVKFPLYNLSKNTIDCLYFGNVTSAVSPILLLGKVESQVFADLQSPAKMLSQNIAAFNPHHWNNACAWENLLEPHTLSRSGSSLLQLGNLSRLSQNLVRGEQGEDCVGEQDVLVLWMLKLEPLGREHSCMQKVWKNPVRPINKSFAVWLSKVSGIFGNKRDPWSHPTCLLFYKWLPCRIVEPTLTKCDHSRQLDQLVQPFQQCLVHHFSLFGVATNRIVDPRLWSTSVKVLSEARPIPWMVKIWNAASICVVTNRLAISVKNNFRKWFPCSRHKPTNRVLQWAKAVSWEIIRFL